MSYQYIFVFECSSLLYVIEENFDKVNSLVFWVNVAGDYFDIVYQ